MSKQDGILDETLEEWVERIGQMPIWRELCILLDSTPITGRAVENYKKQVIKELGEAFSDDVFSLHWLKAPQEITLTIHSAFIQHANVVLLHARNEVTEGMPEKEQLWRALRAIYEECERLKTMNISLSYRIEELEEEDD